MKSHSVATVAQGQISEAHGFRRGGPGTMGNAMACACCQSTNSMQSDGMVLDGVVTNLPEVQCDGLEVEPGQVETGQVEPDAEEAEGETNVGVDTDNVVAEDGDDDAPVSVACCGLYGTDANKARARTKEPPDTGTGQESAS